MEPPPPAQAFLPEGEEIKKLGRIGAWSGCSIGLVPGYLLLILSAQISEDSIPDWARFSLILFGVCAPSLVLGIWGRAREAASESRHREGAAAELSAWLAANGLRAEALCRAMIFVPELVSGHLVVTPDRFLFVRERGQGRAILDLASRSDLLTRVESPQGDDRLTRLLWRIGSPPPAFQIGAIEVVTHFADRLQAWLGEHPAPAGAVGSHEDSSPEDDTPREELSEVGSTPTGTPIQASTSTPTPAGLPWQELSQCPESYERSSWRGAPSVLLEACLRSLPLSGLLLLTASAGAAGLMFLLQLALLPLEKRVRTRSRSRRWFGALTLLLPVILIGLTILRTQAGFAEALGQGALWTAALPKALANLEIQSWEELIPEGIGIVILFFLCGTRIRLLSRRWTLALVAAAWLPLMFLSAFVQEADLTQPYWEPVFALFFFFFLMPLGIMVGVLADFAELGPQWLILRDERPSPPRITSLWEELSDALAAGRAPSWGVQGDQDPQASSEQDEG